MGVKLEFLLEGKDLDLQNVTSTWGAMWDRITGDRVLLSYNKMLRYICLSL
jgi:hypothetical protein